MDDPDFADLVEALAPEPPPLAADDDLYAELREAVAADDIDHIAHLVNYDIVPLDLDRAPEFVAFLTRALQEQNHTIEPIVTYFYSTGLGDELAPWLARRADFVRALVMFVMKFEQNDDDDAFSFDDTDEERPMLFRDLGYFLVAINRASPDATIIYETFFTNLPVVFPEAYEYFDPPRESRSPQVRRSQTVLRADLVWRVHESGDDRAIGIMDDVIISNLHLSRVALFSARSHRAPSSFADLAPSKRSRGNR